jgi:hypothetical protein
MPTATHPKATPLKPPATLSPSARKIFTAIAAAESHFRPAHVYLLAAYAEACALQEVAAIELQREDADAVWLLKWEKATRAMASLAMRLKLCPQSPSVPKGRPLGGVGITYDQLERLRPWEAG